MLVNATEQFLSQAVWLRDDESAPIVASLRILAAEIDSTPTASLVAEYSRLIRYARNIKPALPEALDPITAILTRQAS